MPKRGISQFSRKNIVVSQYRKYFVGEPFFVSENFLYRKNLWIRGGRGGGSITIFRQKNVCLTVPKNFVGEPFSVSLISGTERFYASEIYLTILCRNFFCLSAQKFRRGTFLICVSEKIWYRKKLWIRGGGGGEGGGSITIFGRKFLVSQWQNISWACLQCFRKFWVSKNFMHNSITIFRWKYFVSRCRKIS